MLSLYVTVVPLVGPVVDAKVTIVVHGPATLVALWIVKLVSLIELSVQVNLAMFPCRAAFRLLGALGGIPAAVERIMSFSSCASMWQCQVNSEPKLIRWFTSVVGCPVGSKNPSAAVLSTVPNGVVGSTGRMLLGTSKGNVGVIGLKAMIVSCNGFILTVSFQPSSVGSGHLTLLSQATRLMS